MPDDAGSADRLLPSESPTKGQSDRGGKLVFVAVGIGSFASVVTLSGAVPALPLECGLVHPQKLEKDLGEVCHHRLPRKGFDGGNGEIIHDIAIAEPGAWSALARLGCKVVILSPRQQGHARHKGLRVLTKDTSVAFIILHLAVTVSLSARVAQDVSKGDDGLAIRLIQEPEFREDVSDRGILAHSVLI